MSQSVKTAIDKFKVDETSPFFPIGPMAPTGSYGNFNSGLRNQYILKFKDNETKSVIRTSGIVGSNLKTVPPTVPPLPPTPPITILNYSTDLDPPGSSFEWSGVTWTFDSTLPNYSWSADVSTITGSVPNSSSLISVAIGTSVTSIGDSSFIGCTSLTSITIPDSVTSIENAAFAACSSLTSITIPNLVTSLGVYGFQDCTSLTSINLPNSLISIGLICFGGCTSLPSIILPNSLESIGNNAFISCTGLTSITIPNSVTSIGYNAFYGSGLTTVTISNNQLDDILSPSDDVSFYGRTVTTILP